MKKGMMDFILKIVEMSYKFLSKLKCACCVGKCDVDKSVHVDLDLDIEVELEYKKKSRCSSV